MPLPLKKTKSLRPVHRRARASAGRGAYSRLAELMQARQLTIGQFQKKLTAKGHHFDPKTLYRLASDKPLLNISAPVIRAVCETLDVEIGRLIVWEPPAPKLGRINIKTQKRLDYLMSKSNEGELAGDERTELEALVIEMERLSIQNAKILAKHAPSTRKGRAVGPVNKLPSKSQKPLEV